MMIQGYSGASSPEGAQSARDGQQLQEDLNRFLNLLVTQLQNQDPLDPMDANEFTSQLVQFASVEQQIYQNANLEKLLKVEQSGQIAAMVDYLGTTAEAVGKVLPLTEGQARGTYALAENAASTTIAVMDATGRPVFVTSGETGNGVHEFTWDGRNLDGKAVPDGAYTLEVSAKRADGSLLDVTQTAIGRVTGTSVENGQVMLFMGDVAVPMEDVLSVQETAES